MSLVSVSPDRWVTRTLIATWLVVCGAMATRAALPEAPPLEISQLYAVQADQGSVELVPIAERGIADAEPRSTLSIDRNTFQHRGHFVDIMYVSFSPIDQSLAENQQPLITAIADLLASDIYNFERSQASLVATSVLGTTVATARGPRDGSIAPLGRAWIVLKSISDKGIWIALGLSGLCFAIWVPSVLRSLRGDHWYNQGRCLDCGYDITGVLTCPECGKEYTLGDGDMP